MVGAGCSAPPAAPAGTGASEAAEAFFTALVARDWPTGHTALDDATRAKWPLDTFRTKAAAFRADWGFDPESVHVKSCDERGDEATAHVVLSGKGKDGHRQLKDAVVLHRGASGWRIFLPENFGKPHAGR
jgi:hypothetical protein